MLDIFCGLGGVSDGFAAEGFDVLGVDIEDMPAKGYKHKFLRADIRDLKGEDFRGYDVIWGSPPCREFSGFATIARARLKNNQKGQWKKPPNLEEGLVVVKTFLSFVSNAKPKCWIMENVSGLAKHLQLKPLAYGTKIKGQKRHVFYGNIQPFLIPQTNSLPMGKYKGRGKMISWKRVKIPLACSRAFAQACREALEEMEEKEDTYRLD
jgi:site-specific DNA-cytosine methylase